MNLFDFGVGWDVVKEEVLLAIKAYAYPVAVLLVSEVVLKVEIIARQPAHKLVKR